MTTLDEQQELEALLPFYVNGSLDEHDKARVENALAESEHLRQELAFVEILQKQVQQQTGQSPGEFGLKRLQRSIKDQQRLTEQPTIQKESKRWQFLAIAASLALVFQTVTTTLEQQDDYRAAGGDNAVQHYVDTVSVTFASEATEQQIRQLLLEQQVIIIDGPSALGIYRLALMNDADATFQALKARTDLIESIQQD